ncbi:MAG: hypothetical protein C4B59_00100 [Candidatus Methanogaster sp.]|uniref:Uncharacterized protein n=1 Tax=Candidatus Methanogaster sp. TaxID=3386292 RepID=A0AC61L6L6_9EURY|nr:MAG: hypothetical protein C4B59_00100 [ANME-2 cluster archaeon]
MPVYVADSSVFILGMPLPSRVRNRIITTPEVVSELVDMKSKMAFEDALESGVEVELPLANLITEVRSHASRTGDIERLSDTDIGILAKALEYGGILCTDDYAIQNVAESLGIKTEPILQDGIKETFEWGRRCKGCGRRFEGDVRICPICGSETKGYKKSRKVLR